MRVKQMAMIIFILAAMSLGCDKSNMSSSGLDREAEETGNNFANYYYKNCKNTSNAYLAAPSVHRECKWEYKECTVKVNKQVLSEEEKLNKYEWKGEFAISCTSPYRLIEGNGQPEEWSESDPRQRTLEQRAFFKQDGKWSFAHKEDVFLPDNVCENPGVVDNASSVEAQQVKKAKTPSPAPDSTTGMEFVQVKGGCFQMGDTFGDGGIDEKPVHKVCLDDFSIGKYEVTQAQWKTVMGSDPSDHIDCGSCPVDKVSWNDIQKFIKKLSSQTGRSYRLPTEAEWEYAARSGGKSEKYSGGDDVDGVAWYADSSGYRSHPVGQRRPNGLGIYDMSGNIWEWCQDWYSEKYYKSSPTNNPKGPSGGRYRVQRGGFYMLDAAEARAAVRSAIGPGQGSSGFGFRLVRR